ncbi:hypothetical protein PoB_001028100, partial [Plakobranchus ocellatus]
FLEVNIFYYGLLGATTDYYFIDTITAFDAGTSLLSVTVNNRSSVLDYSRLQPSLPPGRYYGFSSFVQFLASARDSAKVKVIITANNLLFLKPFRNFLLKLDWIFMWQTMSAITDPPEDAIECESQNISKIYREHFGCPSLYRNRGRTP